VTAGPGPDWGAPADGRQVHPSGTELQKLKVWVWVLAGTGAVVRPAPAAAG